MAGSIAIPSHSSAQALDRTAAVTIPWYIWASVFGVTCAMVGVHWDISWHRSIGRDTFWTPPHLLIQLCGIIAGITCGYMILATTFMSGMAQLRSASVNIWGFRGPLGAFISSWGGFAMITSAPFDDWWHQAYGLDVKIVSPPHMILAAGILAVELGVLILILGFMNRAEGKQREWLNWLFLYVGTMVIVLMATLTLEYTGRVFQHTAFMYFVVCLAMPSVIASVARASQPAMKWAATSVTGFYMLFYCLLIWTLPLFPATPKLGPVYNPVTQFIPPAFPLLLIVPALALDLLWARTQHWNRWLLAAVSGLVFLGVLLAAQWPFANFLMSPMASNGFFGTIYRGYYEGSNSLESLNRFWTGETASQFWANLGRAGLTAMITMAIGLAAGDWMRRVKR